MFTLALIDECLSISLFWFKKWKRDKIFLAFTFVNLTCPSGQGSSWQLSGFGEGFLGSYWHACPRRKSNVVSFNPTEVRLYKPTMIYKKKFKNWHVSTTWPRHVMFSSDPATKRSKAEVCCMGRDSLNGPSQTVSKTGPAKDKC